jgi:copper transport protein
VVAPGLSGDARHTAAVHVTTRKARAALLLVAVLVSMLLASAAPAAAHAELVDTDPDQGAVLERMPDVVRLTFSEAVLLVPDGVTVTDAAGNELASRAGTSGDDLLVTVEDPVDAGTVVVAFRVVSDDGHPIAGKLVFSIGAPSPKTVPPVTQSSPASLTFALGLSRWPAYTGLLLAVGLVWFLALMVPGEIDTGAGVRERLRTTARSAAVVSVVAWLTGLLLDGAYLSGRGFGSLGDSTTLGAVPRREVVAVLVLALALVAAVRARGTTAALAALVALVPVALVGHSVAMPHAQLNVVVDGFHLVAAATWLGGLVGLVTVLRGTSSRSDVALLAVARFSAAAATALVALVAAGTVLAWQLVGSWGGLVHAAYGRLLLAKLVLAAVAVAVAAYNRYHLVPRGAGARTLLTRTVGVEAAVLVVVVLVTGFLVQEVPPARAGATTTVPGSPLTGRADLGGLQATVTLDPGRTGTNTVTVEIDNSSGVPAELFTPPELRVLGETNDVGDIPIGPTALGVYQGSVVLPTPGTWRFRVAVRVDEDTVPDATVELAVR